MMVECWLMMAAACSVVNLGEISASFLEKVSGIDLDGSLGGLQSSARLITSSILAAGPPTGWQVLLI
jgi:hypothetical protein